MADRGRRIAVRTVAGLVGLVAFLAVAEISAGIALRLLGVPMPARRGERREAPTVVLRAPDERLPTEKPWFRTRIVCLGDSCTYGFGVGSDQAYPRQLERLLNERAGHQRFEVVNLGVGGYTSTLGLSRLREIALGFDPDVIVFSFGLNDKWRAEMTDREKEAWERSRILWTRRKLEALLWRSRLFQLLRFALAPWLRLGRVRFAGLEVEYRVPLAEYRENLAAMVLEARAAGARVVFLSMAESPEIAALAREGVASFKQGQIESAVRTLERLVSIEFMYRPRPYYYLARSYEALGQHKRAAQAMRRARELAILYPFPHPIDVPVDRVKVRSHLDGASLEPDGDFDIFGRYREVMSQVAAVHEVPLVDVAALGLGPEDYFDYCHLLGPAYSKVAAALAQVLWREVLPQGPSR